MVKAICIDSNNKPKEIHPSRWVSKGKEYHITHVYFHPKQGIEGVELHELELTHEDQPYETYALKRFGIREEDLEAFMQLIRDCNDIKDVDISELEELLQQEVVYQEY